ncbi:MAG: DUF2924 domain-containing protein [Alphaproteobacteria bacterium]|nr:DUF2924 domain-containing protein [Alphaproteobacteria bacterium]
MSPPPSPDDLQRLSLNALRAAWRSRFTCTPPAFRSRDLVLRTLLYRLEEERFGGMKSGLKKRLTELEQRFVADPAYDPAPRIAPPVGSALVREWNGVRHVVLVTAEGFQYRDQTYASLTQAAKAISGTHQSGPLFFGLVGRATARPEKSTP